MFKSKLQEFCHEKKWALPIYSCMKDGADHNPQFKASVLVDGINFETNSISKSLKEAHNEAAKLAFIYFSSDNKETVEGPKTEQTVLKCSDMISNAPSNEAEVQQSYMMKLQVYAQRKKLGLPLYHTKRKDQHNVLSFRATVAVGEDIFESPGLYKTTKQAEDAAAQAALMSLSTNVYRENDDCLYKNLLQEFAQDNGYFLPEYNTLNSGRDHKLTFFSTVEVEGEVFHGNPEKSKKLAELSAAKVAYTILMQRKSCSLDDYSSSSSKDEILNLAPHFDSLTIADQTKNCKPGFQVEECKDEDEEIDFAENVSSKTAKFSNQEVTAGPMLLATDSSSKKTTEEIKSYLLCNRVRVYTCIPDVTFSEGNVVLPIAENKWVVVNLDFPKAKDA